MKNTRMGQGVPGRINLQIVSTESWAELPSDTAGLDRATWWGGSITLVLSWQVDPDDVLTKEEQIYLLVEAKERCQGDIKAQLEKIKGSALPLCMGQPALVEKSPWGIPPWKWDEARDMWLLRVCGAPGSMAAVGAIMC